MNKMDRLVEVAASPSLLNDGIKCNRLDRRYYSDGP
jgi:hypothetical protein